jgi:hypothetical protein
MPITPKGQVTRSKQVKPGYEGFEPQIEIAAWSADTEATLPPEQVHFIIHFPADYELPPMVMRFKSPDTIGFLIEEMIKFRRYVWPDSKKVTGEK